MTSYLVRRSTHPYNLAHSHPRLAVTRVFAYTAERVCTRGGNGALRCVSLHRGGLSPLGCAPINVGMGRAPINVGSTICQQSGNKNGCNRVLMYSARGHDHVRNRVHPRRTLSSIVQHRTPQCSRTVQSYSSVAQYSRSVQSYSTAVHHSRAGQYHSTVVQYSRAVQ